jgi:hypothetical protein
MPQVTQGSICVPKRSLIKDKSGLILARLIVEKGCVASFQFNL